MYVCSPLAPKMQDGDKDVTKSWLYFLIAEAEVGRTVYMRQGVDQTCNLSPE